MWPDRKELGRAGPGGGREGAGVAQTRGASAGWLWSGKERFVVKPEQGGELSRERAGHMRRPCGENEGSVFKA